MQKFWKMKILNDFIRLWQEKYFTCDRMNLIFCKIFENSMKKGLVNYRDIHSEFS